MTFVPTLDSEGPRRPRIPRTLDPVEVRVLGALMEKQLSTPEYYPLTLNALVAACNQKSNREPVMELSEQEIQRALDRLPAEQREAFVLKYVEELSYEQMAEITGAGVSALKMRVKRACERLRELLEGAYHV
jgi:RNA polymerase sigma factor (sigma-70 family)